MDTDAIPSPHRARTCIQSTAPATQTPTHRRPSDSRPRTKQQPSQQHGPRRDVVKTHIEHEGQPRQVHNLRQQQLEHYTRNHDSRQRIQIQHPHLRQPEGPAVRSGRTPQSPPAPRACEPPISAKNARPTRTGRSASSEEFYWALSRTAGGPPTRSTFCAPTRTRVHYSPAVTLSTEFIRATIAAR
jgi:hypothetical protein